MLLRESMIEGRSIGETRLEDYFVDVQFAVEGAQADIHLSGNQLG